MTPTIQKDIYYKTNLYSKFCLKLAVLNPYNLLISMSNTFGAQPSLERIFEVIENKTTTEDTSTFLMSFLYHL